MKRAGGGWSYTIVWPDGSVDEEADSFLRGYDGRGTQKTYAYFLVDHMRWRARESLTIEAVSIRDLFRYTGAVGARVAMPFGEPWRKPPQRPYGASALQIAASCLRGFYLHQCGLGVNPELRVALEVSELPTQADRDRALSGHVMTSVPKNPLAPRHRVSRRHPKMLLEGARPELLNTARDEMVVTWLSDSSLRIGGLTGLLAPYRPAPEPDAVDGIWSLL